MGEVRFKGFGQLPMSNCLTREYLSSVWNQEFVRSAEDSDYMEEIINQEPPKTNKIMDFFTNSQFRTAIWNRITSVASKFDEMLAARTKRIYELENRLTLLEDKLGLVYKDTTTEFKGYVSKKRK